MATKNLVSGSVNEPEAVLDISAEKMIAMQKQILDLTEAKAKLTQSLKDAHQRIGDLEKYIADHQVARNSNLLR